MGTVFLKVQLCNRVFLYRHWLDFRLLYKEIETLYFPEFIETRNHNICYFLPRTLKSSGLYVNIRGAFCIQPWRHLWVIVVNPKYWRVQETVFKSNFSTLHSRPSWPPKHLCRTTGSRAPSSSCLYPFLIPTTGVMISAGAFLTVALNPLTITITGNGYWMVTMCLTLL